MRLLHISDTDACKLLTNGQKTESALSLPGPEHFAEKGRPAEENLDIIKVTSQGDGGTSAAYLAARAQFQLRQVAGRGVTS